MRLLLLIPFLAGCAAAIQVGPTAPAPEPAFDPDRPDPGAEIIIYRASEAGFLGNLATNPGLTLNGEAVGTCRFGRPLPIRLPPGTYRVGAITAAGSVDAEVEAVLGQTTYLRCGTAATPSLSPAPQLTPVDAATAAREVGL